LHYLIGDAIGFLLVNISRLTDCQLRLNSRRVLAARAAAAAGAGRLSLQHGAV
jgi:hypothetical protein